MVASLKATVRRLSWRVRHTDVARSREAKALQRRGTCVFAVWHQRLFAFLRHIRGTRGTIMVSLSPDGEIIAASDPRSGGTAMAW